MDARLFKTCELCNNLPNICLNLHPAPKYNYLLSSILIAVDKKLNLLVGLPTDESLKTKNVSHSTQDNIIKIIPSSTSINNINEIDLEEFTQKIRVKQQTLDNNLKALYKSNAIIEFDLDGQILNVNDLFLELLGYTEDEVIGQHHSIFIDPKTIDLDEYKLFWEKLRKGEFQQDEFKRIRKDGQSVWLRGNYNPILNAEGKPETVLKIATDITLTKNQQIEIDAITTAIYKSNLTIEFDLEGRILKANDIFLNRMGYVLAEVKDKHHSMFLDRETATSAEYLSFWSSLQKGQYQSGEYMRVTKGGETVWIKGNYNPIFDAEGKPFKVIKIASDITKTKQQQLELTEMNQKLKSHSDDLKIQHNKLQQINLELELKTKALEQKNKEVEAAKLLVDQKTTQLEISSKYKSEFLANMSHELRTPLNSLLILSQDLAENRVKNLSDEQVESAEIMYRSGCDLLELINEVLDLSKIEAGKMTLNVSKVSINGFTKELINDFKHQAEKKNLTYTVTQIGELPTHITTDKQRLGQVLRNIISNAIKFTSVGGVKVEIFTKDENLHFKVTDSGIGISLPEQSSVFEPFHQADSSTSRKYGGTGLGLSISRDLIKLLRGEITLESTVHKGSIFTVYIPLILNTKAVDLYAIHDVDEDLNGNQQPELRKFFSNREVDENSMTIRKDESPIFVNDFISELAGKNILIVDDDMRNMFALSKILRDKGMNILKSDSGKVALEILQSERKIDLVLMDIMMPEMNGYEVIAKIREIKNLDGIPIIALTAKAMKEDWQKCLQAGANGYLTKPLDIKKLLEMMCDNLN